MYYPKCSFPSCYITAKELLINVQQGEWEVFVCPQHLSNFREYLNYKGNWNSYKKLASHIEEKHCCLCDSKDEPLRITTPGVTGKTAILCPEHAENLVAGRLSKADLSKLKSHHSDLHLLFAV